MIRKNCKMKVKMKMKTSTDIILQKVHLLWRDGKILSKLKTFKISSKENWHKKYLEIFSTQRRKMKRTQLNKKCYWATKAFFLKTWMNKLKWLRKTVKVWARWVGIRASAARQVAYCRQPRHLHLHKKTGKKLWKHHQYKEIPASANFFSTK